MGGLGNQLFQIFATISYAIDNKTSFVFLNTDELVSGTTVRSTYWNTFLVNLKRFTRKELPKLLYIKEKTEFQYNNVDLTPYLAKDICLYGYFQSYKYFIKNFNFICNVIDIKAAKELVFKKSGYSLDFFENVTSMHFRLGDYKKLQHVYPLMTAEYYKNALLFIKSVKTDLSADTILYFCEENDLEEVNEIICELKTVFLDTNFIIATNKFSDWEQMLLMSCCKNNIIANSTFSWWGAFFNTNDNRIICYPEKWIYNHNTGDLFLPDWNIISS
jgi:hypothetical protein